MGMQRLRGEGNDRFRAGDHEAAVIMYQRAIELYDSERLADAQGAIDEHSKASGNLCTCLFKLGQYSNCVAAAKAALLVNPFLAKAHAFLGLCLRETAEVSVIAACTAHVELFRSVWLLPELEPQVHHRLTESLRTFLAEQSSVIEDCVEVRDSASSGRGVFATSLLPAGAVVATFDAPFAVTSYAETDGRGACSHCGRPYSSEVSSIPCHSCGAVSYCTLQCSVEHAARHHGSECHALQRFSEMVRVIEEEALDIPVDFEDIARITVAIRSGVVTKSPGFGEVLEMESHSDLVVQSLHPLAAMLFELFPDDDRAFIIKLIGISWCNSIEITDSTSLGVGHALYVRASLFNHSCMPNCAIDNLSRSIVSIRPIAPGEQLSISYIPQMYWPRSLRREGLQQRYFFSCECERCALTDDAFESIVTAHVPGARPDATKYYHVLVDNICTALRQKPVNSIGPDHWTELRQLWTECESHLHPLHYLFHDLRNTMTFVASVLGLAKEAARLCMDELLLWECIVPGALPLKRDKVRNLSRCAGEDKDVEKVVGEWCPRHPLLNCLSIYLKAWPSSS